MKEFLGDTLEEPVNVDWTLGTNGRGRLTKRALGVKRKTPIETGGLCEA